MVHTWKNASCLSGGQKRQWYITSSALGLNEWLLLIMAVIRSRAAMKSDQTESYLSPQHTINSIGSLL